MLTFQPHYQPAIWGGRRLAEAFGRPLPPGPIGESWELCELPQQHTPVAEGAEAGARLGELWRAGRLGGSAQGPFPFLLKWIDARRSLSVQVHPDEATCRRLGHGRSKTEAWYVVEADPGAELLIGHHPGLDGAALRQAALGGTLTKWLYATAPRPGDMHLLQAGTIHAIGAGFVLLEVQQPSDTTFRIYDFGRLGDDGQPRALHLEEAAEAVNYRDSRPPRAGRQEVVGPCFRMRPMPAGSTLPPGPLRVLACDRPQTVVELLGRQRPLRLGEVVVAEPADGPIQVVAGGLVWVSEP